MSIYIKPYSLSPSIRLGARPQWPIMSAILHGVSGDQLMARPKANHIQEAYAPSVELADKALTAKASLFAEMGVIVHLCGEINVG